MEAYTISYCVKSALVSRGETSMRYYQQGVQFGIEIFRRLNLAGMMPTNRTQKLDIDQNTLTAPLPCDYVDWLKVGLCVNGRWLNLSYNENICNCVQGGITDECGCHEDFMTDVNNISAGFGGDDGVPVWWYYPYFYNGLWCDGLYGYGAGRYRGGFKILKEQGRIALDSYITGENILLEYMSNGISGAGTLVPEGAVGCITQWILYKYSLNSKDRLQAQEYKMTFNAEFIGFRTRFASMGLWDWKEGYMRSLSQSVKR